MGRIFHTVTAQGLVCFGPSTNGQTTFVRVDQWLGARLPARDRAEAEAEIARRFLLAYGPANVGDFAYWAGLYVPPARRMWERIAGEMRAVTVSGKPAFVHSSVKAPPRAASPTPHVRLLPNFDAFLLGHKGKDACVAPKFYKRVFKNAGWISWKWRPPRGPTSSRRSRGWSRSPRSPGSASRTRRRGRGGRNACRVRRPRPACATASRREPAENGVDRALMAS